MHGEWVEISLTEDIEIRVFILCCPDTPTKEKRRRAEKKLLAAILRGEEDETGDMQQSREV